MSEQLTLAAEARERAGKGASRELRRRGRVPAVIYGAGEAPVSIHLEEKLLVRTLQGGHFMNTVVMIDGLGGAPVRTLPKDLAFHPVTDRPIHVDFLRIGEHAQVTVTVPIVFEGQEDAPGLQGDALLNIVANELSVTCDASEIPGEIRVSVAQLEAGGSIHLADVQLPRGVAYAGTEENPTLATVALPAADDADALQDGDVAPDAVPSEQGTTDSEPTRTDTD